MAFKFVILVAFVAYVNGGVVAPADYQGRLGYAAKPLDADYDSNPQYSYAYDVQDSLTGDYKQHQESRSGDVVQGSYSFLEADGSRRIVEYTADPENGFNAVIRKEEDGLLRSQASALPPAPLLLQAKAPAPVAKIAAPARIESPGLAYAAPITHVSYSTPLFSYSH